MKGKPAALLLAAALTLTAAPAFADAGGGLGSNNGCAGHQPRPPPGGVATKGQRSYPRHVSYEKTTVRLSSRETIMAQAPVIHVGSDTRAKSQEEAMRDAEFAIRETGLQVSFTSGPHIAGAGTLNGAGVAVLVTCLAVGGRTFIEVVGTSLDSGAAEQTRNRVRTITMGSPS
jgi:hypothetical protein